VLTVSGGNMRFELSPSLFNEMLFIPQATCAHEVASCKKIGVANVYLLRVSNENATCLRIICTILNLLEQGFNWLLEIQSSAHALKVDFKIHRCDVAVSAEEVIHHVPGKIHQFKNTDDLFFKSLLHGCVCTVSLDVLLPNVVGCANLGGCAIRVGWGPPWGVWAYPKCWACIRWWGDHCIGCIRNDESQVSQSASTQVGINHPRVCLKKLPGGVNCLVIQFALNCWKYRVRESRYDILDDGLLHLDVLGGPECLYALLIQKRFGPGYQRDVSVV
jgi:hypothetical protein